MSGPRDDKVTRGKTRPKRLRLVDEALVFLEEDRLKRRVPDGFHSVVIDVGLGARPDTTLELANALGAVSPGLTVVGVDIDPYRVATARQLARGRATFRVGGFELPLDDTEQALAVRALNLLREYHPDDVEKHHAFLGAQLAPGGVLLEGSSDGEGQVVCLHVLRNVHGRVVREALLFLTDFERGFSPNLFRDWLPQDLRGQAGTSGALTPFFERWREAVDAARSALGAEAPLLRVFDDAAAALEYDGVQLLRLDSGARGLLWRPEGGVPRRNRS